MTTEAPDRLEKLREQKETLEDLQGEIQTNSDDLVCWLDEGLPRAVNDAIDRVNEEMENLEGEVTEALGEIETAIAEEEVRSTIEWKPGMIVRDTGAFNLGTGSVLAVDQEHQTIWVGVHRTDNRGSIRPIPKVVSFDLGHAEARFEIVYDPDAE
ncbi:MAG: hypothetical protein ABEL51_15750 [Salinibacter sp.]